MKILNPWPPYKKYLIMWIYATTYSKPKLVVALEAIKNF